MRAFELQKWFQAQLIEHVKVKLIDHVKLSIQQIKIKQKLHNTQ